MSVENEPAVNFSESIKESTAKMQSTVETIPYSLQVADAASCAVSSFPNRILHDSMSNETIQQDTVNLKKSSGATDATFLRYNLHANSKPSPPSVVSMPESPSHSLILSSCGSDRLEREYEGQVKQPTVSRLLDFGSNLEQDPLRNRQGHRYFLFVILLVLVAIIVLVVTLPITFDTDKRQLPKDRNDTLAQAPPSDVQEQHTLELQRLQEFSNLISKLGISNETFLQTFNHQFPQAHAIQWLASGDEAKLDATNATLEDEIVQRYLVALLYFSLRADQAFGPILDSFLSAKHVCDWKYNLGDEHWPIWQGIFCLDPLQPKVVTNITIERVIGLENGTIPTELCHLSGLRWLDLSENDMACTIPNQIGSCTELQFLSLDENNCTGTIPSTIGGLTNLLTFEFNQNRISGLIPTEIARLTNLASLTGEDNHLVGGLPSELGNLSALTDLRLGGNPLGSTIPTYLGYLKDMRFIRLHSSQFTGTLPTELGQLTQLKRIKLDDNALTGNIPSEITAISTLELMNVSNNLLSGPIPESSTWTKLIDIDFRQNMLTGSLDTTCQANPGLLIACADCGTSPNASLPLVACSCCAEFRCCT